MTSEDIRKKFRQFLGKQGHKWIPPAPLVPENDPTTLFTSSGMQPLVPYLLGQPHPEGKRLANSQPSLRLEDIEEVGDNRHTTFFEMLGNWSLGDYFKKEQLPWFWEFLTKELNLDSNKLHVTVFEGNDQVPKDTESEEIWKNLGVPPDHIFFYGVKNNWWSRSGTPEQMPPGEIGGPDSEVFYEFIQVEHDKKYGEKCHPNCDCGRFLEIGNSVFIQYQKQADGSLKELPNKNVDFGGGLERLTAAVNNEPDIFKINIFYGAIKFLEEQSKKNYGEHYEINRSFRIIAEHLRASAMLIIAGVRPDNKLQGYVLRRLLRRAMFHGHLLGFELSGSILPLVCKEYSEDPEINKNWPHILEVIDEEGSKFGDSLDRGLKQFEKTDIKDMNGLFTFNLYQTYGFPLELTLEILKQKGKEFTQNDLKEFEEVKKAHSDLSRAASAGIFKGGLANHSEITTKYHTATHLLHAALRKILGDQIQQKGSNITVERLRFDFSHQSKLTDDELKKVEGLVNEKIRENLPVTSEIMNKDKALKSGTLGFFTQKYGDKVTVYTIDDFSKEICGGPHVDFTGKLGKLRIEKEESAGSGIRRIYATIDKR